MNETSCSKSPFLLFLIGCLVSQSFDRLEKGYLNQHPQDFWVKAVISLLTGWGFPTPCKRLLVYVFPFRNCYPEKFNMDIAHGQFQKYGVLWVDSRENPATVSRGMAANCVLEDKVKRVERGEVIGNVQELVFLDPNYFRAGELHSNATYWEEIAQRNPSSGQNEILRWIRERVSIFPYFKHFVDNLKAKKV